MNGSINSPFRYAGGKFYARKLILTHVPSHTAYIEPFAGGGSIFFAKHKVPFNQLNDIDDELINVYMTIRDNPEDLIYFLKGRTVKESRIPEKFTNSVLFGALCLHQRNFMAFSKMSINRKMTLKEPEDGTILIGLLTVA